MINLRKFYPLRVSEVPEMFRLILKRIAWMDEKGIRQWNVMDYEKAFPLEFYEALSRNEMVFGLREEAGTLVAAAVLTEADDNWSDDGLALYLHSFVTEVGSEAGGEFLRQAEDYARGIGKTYFRLDSAADNPGLARYYESQGFQAVGTCKDGAYTGILRQKQL